MAQFSTRAPVSVILLLLVFFVALAPTVAQARPMAASQAPLAIASLQKEVARLALPAKGLIGVSAWRLDGKGPRLLHNADQRFPLASTFKVAVAGAILSKVDNGDLSLERMVTADPSMYVPPSVIADRLIHPGVSLSIHNLLELMITQSDNSATDVLIAAAGGPAAVTRWLRGQGITDQNVDRDTAHLIRDFFVLPDGPVGAVFENAAQADPSFMSKGSQPNPIEPAAIIHQAAYLTRGS